MMYVDEEKCIGCKLCISDCIVRKDIDFVEGKANIKDVNCFK